MPGPGQLIFKSTGARDELMQRPGNARGPGNIYQSQGRLDGLESRRDETFERMLRQSSLERNEMLQRREQRPSETEPEDTAELRPRTSQRRERADRADGPSQGNRLADNEDAVREDGAGITEEAVEGDQGSEYGLLAQLTGFIRAEAEQETEDAAVEDVGEASPLDRFFAAARGGGAASAAGDGGEVDVSLQFLEGQEGLDLELTQGGQRGRSGMELLNFQELMDPEIQIEAGDDLMERLQQALQTGNRAALEEAGEAVAPQVIRGLAALMRGNGVSEMRLQLQPADLGEIELRVRALEGIVRGEISVQSTEVKQLLETQMDRLRTALAQQGFELEGFDIEVADRAPSEDTGDGWGRDNPFNGGERRGGRQTTAAAAAVESQPASGLELNGDNEVNVVA